MKLQDFVAAGIVPAVEDGILPSELARGRSMPLKFFMPVPLGWKPDSTAGKMPAATAANGFTLVEVLVTLSLLALIVLALMAVFSGTQRAFRASLTQTDSLEGGRAVMDLIANDLTTMTPSYSDTNNIQDHAVNFYAEVWPYNSPPSPLVQSLVGNSSGAQRTNVLERFFILSRQNQAWIGTGYLVSTNLPDGTLYPLYRFYMTTNAMSGDAGRAQLFNDFAFAVSLTNSSVWSHLMDGVVNLTIRAFDTNGVWMTNGYSFGQRCSLKNTEFKLAQFGEVGFVMYSNSLPASVEIELGTLEDRTLQHAESIPDPTTRSNYLAQHAGQVHLFRQRVWIRNLDPSAYQ